MNKKKIKIRKQINVTKIKTNNNNKKIIDTNLQGLRALLTLVKRKQNKVKFLKYKERRKAKNKVIRSIKSVRVKSRKNKSRYKSKNMYRFRNYTKHLLTLRKWMYMDRNFRSLRLYHGFFIKENSTKAFKRLFNRLSKDSNTIHTSTASCFRLKSKGQRILANRHFKDITLSRRNYKLTSFPSVPRLMFKYELGLMNRVRYITSRSKLQRSLRKTFYIYTKSWVRRKIRSKRNKKSNKNLLKSRYIKANSFNSAARRYTKHRPSSSLKVKSHSRLKVKPYKPLILVKNIKAVRLLKTHHKYKKRLLSKQLTLFKSLEAVTMSLSAPKKSQSRHKIKSLSKSYLRHKLNPIRRKSPNTKKLLRFVNSKKHTKRKKIYDVVIDDDTFLKKNSSKSLIKVRRKVWWNLNKRFSLKDRLLVASKAMKPQIDPRLGNIVNLNTTQKLNKLILELGSRNLRTKKSRRKPQKRSKTIIKILRSTLLKFPHSIKPELIKLKENITKHQNNIKSFETLEKYKRLLFSQKKGLKPRSRFFRKNTSNSLLGSIHGRLINSRGKKKYKNRTKNLHNFRKLPKLLKKLDVRPDLTLNYKQPSSTSNLFFEKQLIGRKSKVFTESNLRISRPNLLIPQESDDSYVAEKHDDILLDSLEYRVMSTRPSYKIHLKSIEDSTSRSKFWYNSTTLGATRSEVGNLSISYSSGSISFNRLVYSTPSHLNTITHQSNNFITTTSYCNSAFSIFSETKINNPHRTSANSNLNSSISIPKISISNTRGLSKLLTYSDNVRTNLLDTPNDLSLPVNIDKKNIINLKYLTTISSWNNIKTLNNPNTRRGRGANVTSIKYDVDSIDTHSTIYADMVSGNFFKNYHFSGNTLDDLRVSRLSYITYLDGISHPKNFRYNLTRTLIDPVSKMLDSGNHINLIGISSKARHFEFYKGSICRVKPFLKKLNRLGSTNNYRIRNKDLRTKAKTLINRLMLKNLNNLKKRKKKNKLKSNMKKLRSNSDVRNGISLARSTSSKLTSLIKFKALRKDAKLYNISNTKSKNLKKIYSDQPLQNFIRPRIYDRNNSKLLGNISLTVNSSNRFKELRLNKTFNSHGSKQFYNPNTSKGSDVFRFITNTNILLHFLKNPILVTALTSNTNNISKVDNLILNQSLGVFLRKYDYYTNSSLNNKHNNLVPHSKFNKIIHKPAQLFKSYNKFRCNITGHAHNSIIRFGENVLGKKILIQTYPFINQDMPNDYKVRYKIWLPRLEAYARRLGHKFFMEEALHIIHLSFTMKDAMLFIEWLKVIICRISFWKTRMIFKFLRYLFNHYFRTIFPELNIKGLKIKLKGKISVAGCSRKRTILYRVGSNSYSQTSLRILRESTTIRTFTGVMGFQVWIFY